MEKLICETSKRNSKFCTGIRSLTAIALLVPLSFLSADVIKNKDCPHNSSQPCYFPLPKNKTLERITDSTGRSNEAENRTQMGEKDNTASSNQSVEDECRNLFSAS